MVFTVRNIANVQCYNKSKGVLIAVRCLVTRKGWLYFERKDNKLGEYKYCRLQPNPNYSKRPFESTPEICSGNLHITSGDKDTEYCLNVLNMYCLEICNRMFHRKSKKSDEITIHNPMIDNIIIDYYNEKRISRRMESENYTN